jgi:hypothetical protein
LSDCAKFSRLPHCSVVGSIVLIPDRAYSDQWSI